MTKIRLLTLMLCGQMFFVTGMHLPKRVLEVSKKQGEIEITLSCPYLCKTMKDCNDSPFFASVLIINRTDSVASFYEDWNMWGYFSISFEIKTDDSTYIIHKKGRGWDKNFPSYQTLFPGDSMKLDFNLTSTFTGAIPKPGKIMKGMRVIYQTISSLHEDAQRLGFVGGFIKYKYKYLRSPMTLISGPRQLLERIIVDSLKNPVELKRTFPLSRLTSNEYIFTINQ